MSQQVTTFTPLAGGATQVAPETKSDHRKSNSVWNRFKASLKTFQLNKKKFGLDEDRVRAKDGMFYKINAANEYIQKLEAELANPGSAAASPSAPETVSLRAQVENLSGEVTKLSAQLAAANPPKVEDTWHGEKLANLCTAIYGERTVQHLARNAKEAGITHDDLLRRNLHFDALKIPGLNTEDIGAKYGQPKESFGMIRIDRSLRQANADKFLASAHGQK